MKSIEEAGYDYFLMWTKVKCHIIWKWMLVQHQSNIPATGLRFLGRAVALNAELGKILMKEI
jgi:hypothetical protein